MFELETSLTFPSTGTGPPFPQAKIIKRDCIQIIPAFGVNRNSAITEVVLCLHVPVKLLNAEGLSWTPLFGLHFDFFGLASANIFAAVRIHPGLDLCFDPGILPLVLSDRHHFRHSHCSMKRSHCKNKTTLSRHSQRKEIKGDFAGVLERKVWLSQKLT